MGITNIRRPSDVVQRATQSFQDMAIIQPFQQNVLIVSGPMSQADVNKHEWCLRSLHFGSWIAPDHHTAQAQTISPDLPMKTPLIRVSPGLARTSHESEREYVLVIAGLSGASKAKVLIEQSIEGAATTMLHEALNGYSTVFSAAILHRPQSTIFATSLGPSNVKLQRMDTLEDSSSNGNKEITIDLLC